MNNAVAAAGITRARDDDRRRVAVRRAIILGLVTTTGLGLASTLAMVLGANGLSVVDLLMLSVFAITLPWTVLGFWNAVIGFAVLHFSRDPLRCVTPLAGLDESGSTPRHRTAIAVPIYNEDPEMVARHLKATLDDLARTGDLDGFEVFLLSDTNDPALIAEEQEQLPGLLAHPTLRGRLHYRRREHNVGYKTGNIWDFLDRHGDRFDYMIVLDADSLMTGAAIRRLIRVMDANPEVGILQTLMTGLPSSSAFTRLFQFGMRHGMRSFTTGATWWQGPAGPYWGHNALIRVDAFRAHCRIPDLPGKAPWGGLVLSHDLVEAVLMQRAGYGVRVLTDEFGSYELNPPCLPEFVRRSLRWCQGNFQYVRLVARPGWHVMGRVHLALAILMYLSGAAWMVFMTLGFIQGTFGVAGASLVAANPWGAPPSWLGLALFITMLLMTFAPKLAGLADALLDRNRRRGYGGALPLLTAGISEFAYGMLLAPVMALSESFFIIGRLLTGRGLDWRAQLRRDRGVGLAEAVRRFWPQTVAGAVMLTAFSWWAPSLLVWIVPVVVGPLLAIPFACVTTRKSLGEALARSRFAAVPEERFPPAVVSAAIPWLTPERPTLPTATEPQPVAEPMAAGGGD